MELNYELDDLDRKILRELVRDARVPFTDIAKKLIVSGGTIHQRIGKLKLAGVLRGFQPILDKQKLGMSVSALVGINLKNAKDCTAVLEKLDKFKEVVEAHYTTGNYALMIKVTTKDIREFHEFLVGKLQSLSEIQSTESFICLDTPIEKLVKI